MARYHWPKPLPRGELPRERRLRTTWSRKTDCSGSEDSGCPQGREIRSRPEQVECCTQRLCHRGVRVQEEIPFPMQGFQIRCPAVRAGQSDGP